MDPVSVVAIGILAGLPSNVAGNYAYEKTMELARWIERKVGVNVPLGQELEPSTRDNVISSLNALDSGSTAELVALVDAAQAEQIANINTGPGNQFNNAGSGTQVNTNFNGPIGTVTNVSGDATFNTGR